MHVYPVLEHLVSEAGLVPSYVREGVHNLGNYNKSYCNHNIVHDGE